MDTPAEVLAIENLIRDDLSSLGVVFSGVSVPAPADALTLTDAAGTRCQLLVPRAFGAKNCFGLRVTTRWPPEGPLAAAVWAVDGLGLAYAGAEVALPPIAAPAAAARVFLAPLPNGWLPGAHVVEVRGEGSAWLVGPGQLRTAGAAASGPWADRLWVTAPADVEVRIASQNAFQLLDAQNVTLHAVAAPLALASTLYVEHAYAVEGEVD